MFDLIFVIALSVLSLLGFIRGFIKSFFGIINWILAAVIAYLLTPIVAQIFSENYSYMILHSIVSTILFTVTLIILSLLTSGIKGTFLKAIPRPVDQSLGFAFGFTKGYFIVALFFAITTSIYASNLANTIGVSKSKDGRVGPQWLVEAKSYKVLTLGADLLQPMIDRVSDMVTDPKFRKGAQDRLRKEIESRAKGEFDKQIKQNGQGLQDKIDNLQIDDLQKGYHIKEIEKMNRLIETIN